MVFSSFCFGSIRLAQHDSGFANGQTTIRRNVAVSEDHAQSKRFIAVFAGCSTVEFHLAS
jgi:hypothetical protein